ncbi:MAG TPA: LptF/LptG family permease [Opitutaceae bacterium]|nr:LptF/LptG family permease [Opitutaceae bacterium]
MNTFDRYLLREWLQIIALVLAATLGLLFVQAMYTDMIKLLNAGAHLGDVAEYFAVNIPSYLSLLLPLALLVSLLYTLGQMHRHHEFTALRAAGISLWRITAPVWLVGVLFCGLIGWLNSSVVPWSLAESQALLDQLSFRQQEKTLPPDRIGSVSSVAFDNRPAGRMWFFNRYSRFTQQGYGVTVSLLDIRRREHTRLLAAQAGRRTDGPGWVFLDGRVLTFDLEKGELVKTEAFARLVRTDFSEDPDLMLLIDRKPADLSFFELRRLIAYLSASSNPKVTRYEVRYFGLLADILSPLIVIGLAVPFAVSGLRVNPAVGASKSIGLFLLYYALANLGGSLAVKGILTPEMAAWLPSLGMAGLAVWLFARLR